MTRGHTALTVGAAVGSGAVGGVLFGFSTFVMKGLSRLPAGQGIAAMQSINVTAVRPAFMTAMFGTAGACIPLAVHAIRGGGEANRVLLLAGAGLYLVGTIGVTAAYHVPRNNALALLDPSAPGAANDWARYVVEWTRGNHVRTATALAATACFALATRFGDRAG